jgi:hypothetical protein
MLFVTFLFTGCMVFLWLTIFTLVSYAFPDSLTGRTFAVVK